MAENGNIKIVEDVIKCLEGCNPKAEISVWPEGIGFSVIEFPDEEVCLHMRNKETGKTIKLED